MPKNVNRVVKNTGILYGEMLVSFAILLYTTPIILNTLGKVDFGIYALIASIVTMLSFLNLAMATSTQRYLSFHQGSKNIKLQKVVFGNSLLLHICLATTIMLLLEIAGIFLLDDVLDIPPDRIYAAKMVYHCVSFSVFFTILSAPFTASINAHEDMYWVAIVNIIQGILQLVVAVAFVWNIIKSDKLIFYGISMVVISFAIFIFHMIFCIRKYKECSVKIRGSIHIPLLKELLSFAGWNLIGALCGVARNNGLAPILNMFFGIGINTAYGIANDKVSSNILYLSSISLRVFNPQIMKSEGINDRARMLRLSMMTSKFGFAILALVVIPLLFEMESLLTLWLGNLPQYTVLFSQLALVTVMLTQLTVGLQSALQAKGDIKYFQIIIGSLILLNLPISYILLRNGFPPYAVLICSITIEIVAGGVRMLLAKKIVGLSIKEYLVKVYLRLLLPTVIFIAACFAITQYIDINYRFIMTYTLPAISFLSILYLVGLQKNEKNIINKLITSIVSKKRLGS